MKYYSTISYKTRNTLILLTFIGAIVCIGGYFFLYSFPNKTNDAKSQLVRLQQQITSFDGIESEFYQIQDLIQKEEFKLTNLNKQIVTEVSSAKTYSYLNSILDHAGILIFDMYFTDKKNTEGYGYNIYTIKGEGSFDTIYKFLWYIERGPQIYKIKKINLRGIEGPRTGRSKIIVFEIEIWALYASVNELPQIKRTLADIEISSVTNPFNPYVSRSLPPNTANLIEVERADLKAVIPGKAFVADHKGKVHVIKEGDKVYLGYTTKIDATKSQVEFTLNKSGLVKKFRLKLRFSKKIN